MPRIDPVEPPYDREVARRLEAMMPPGVPPILLFRTFVKNLRWQMPWAPGAATS